MKTIALFLLGAALGLAQNSDLGILGGYSAPAVEIVRGSGGDISTASSGHLQFNYARQLKETRAGRLYLELPVLVGGHVRAYVGHDVLGSAGVTFYLTPGIRWNIPVHSRISLYAAAGVGLAGFAGDRASVAGSLVTATHGVRMTLAGEIGGGLDLRLSRIVSLRGEARDFITEAGFDSALGMNRVVYGFGVGFHW